MFLGNHKKTRIKTKRPDDINNIKYIDLLKIDTQGSELNILTGGEQILKNTLCIQLEVSFIPLYERQPCFGEIDVYLRKHGFMPHCIAEQKNMLLYPVAESIFNSNQLFEMDIVYIKDFRDMTVFTEEQLKQIALIMHYCYNSIDMVIRTLKTLDDVYNSDYLKHYIAFSEL